MRVLFHTIDCPEAWDQVKDSLRAGATYPIQMASKVIGEAEMISFAFSPS